MTKPYTLSEILDAIDALRGEATRFWNGFDADTFVRPIGEGWSPADNVRHLVKSTQPVTQALSLPKTGLLVFGRPDHPSSTFDELVARYRSALAGGADAGRFAPSPEPAPADPAARQREIASELDACLVNLRSAASKWTDEKLDQYQLPHPLIGKLTVREMLFFTLYHCEHHAANVRGKLQNSTGAQHG